MYASTTRLVAHIQGVVALGRRLETAQEIAVYVVAIEKPKQFEPLRLFDIDDLLPAYRCFWEIGHKQVSRKEALVRDYVKPIADESAFLGSLPPETRERLLAPRPRIYPGPPPRG